MLSFLFFAFLAYVLFRLVFNFLLPIYRTTKKVKQSFREMNQRMQEEQTGTNAHSTPKNGAPKKDKKPMGDYIDFEEVKD